MGLFGSKKTYVSSTLQNLAGDEADRPNYLKTTVIGNILKGEEDIADTLQTAYLYGPGIKLRNFMNWAIDNYDLIGVPSSTLGSAPDIDTSVLAGEIPVSSGYYAVVQASDNGTADYSWWAEQWMLQNHPDDIQTDWESDYNETTNVITITFDDGSISTFTPANFDRDAWYIYANYLVVRSKVDGDLITGPVHSITEFPDLTGWMPVYNNSTSGSVILTETVETHVTYSDGRPDEDSTTTSTSSGAYTDIDSEYTQDVYNGTDHSFITGNRITATRHFLYLKKIHTITSSVSTSATTEDIGGGVTKTTTVTTTTEDVAYNYTSQDDTQDIIIKEWTGPYDFIYKVGSGNSTLDAMVLVDNPGEPEFFPYIPMRINNRWLSELNNDAWLLAQKAFKKATTGKLAPICDEIDASENVKDMDYVYTAFGVSINVEENACRKYIYNFFRKLMDIQNSDSSGYTLYKAQKLAYDAAYADWIAWSNAQDDSGDPLFDTPEPDVPPLPVMPTSTVRITSQGTANIDTHFDMRILWQSVSESTGTGLAKPDATQGDVWFGTAGSDTFNNIISIGGEAVNVDNTVVGGTALYWQIDENNWKALHLTGFVHYNYIYNGKSVKITLEEGLADGEESGFLVPLHQPTMKAMSLVDTTQMSTACIFLIYNCYVVKKTGLLGSLFFKILIVVVIIAIVVFAPELAPGLVHLAAATGAALGLSGAAALVAGAAITAIASMVITNVIMKVSIKIFGAKLGAIIGMVVAAVAMNAAGNLAMGNGLTVNFGNMLSAANLTKLTAAVGNVASAWINSDIQHIANKSQELQDEYNKEMRAVKDAYANDIGYDNAILDPLDLFVANDSLQSTIETPDNFLSRTTMTGTDIAQLSLTMLENFPDISLALDPTGIGNT